MRASGEEDCYLTAFPFLLLAEPFAVKGLPSDGRGFQALLPITSQWARLTLPPNG